MLNNVDNDTFFLVKYLARIISKEFDRRLNDFGLSATEGSFLFCIWHHTKEQIPLSQSDLQKRFALSKSTVSETLTRLEDKGYISKANEDGKCSVTLTEKGSETLNTVIQTREDIRTQMTNGYSQEEIENICKSIRKMITNIDEAAFICGKK